MDSPRFITLTLDHDHRPLCLQLQRLRQSFSKLRRSPIWRNRVAGGAYTIEITFNRETNQWHPHIHTVIDGEYLPHGDLRNAWEKASEGATIVDIRKVHSARRTAKYISAYIAKGIDGTDFPAERFAELAMSLRGLRMMQCFGTLHGVPMDDAEEYESRKTEYVSCVEPIAELALAGDDRAGSLLARLQLAGSSVVMTETHWDSPDPVHTGLLAELREWNQEHEPKPTVTILDAMKPRTFNERMAEDALFHGANSAYFDPLIADEHGRTRNAIAR